MDATIVKLFLPLFSLIETARASGGDPYHSLRYLYENLSYAKNEEALETPLPRTDIKFSC